MSSGVIDVSRRGGYGDPPSLAAVREIIKKVGVLTDRDVSKMFR
jgi:hypothetical protein